MDIQFTLASPAPGEVSLLLGAVRQILLESMHAGKSKLLVLSYCDFKRQGGT